MQRVTTVLCLVAVAVLVPRVLSNHRFNAGRADGAAIVRHDPVANDVSVGPPVSAMRNPMDFPPKSTLEVVRGEKTIAPAVPAPVTRSQNRIVEYQLTARETAAQIAPNLKYTSLWTFDGVVPGPVMRLKVGDVLRLTLSNDRKNSAPHNIDFHFASGACGGCCDTSVKPAESKTIEVRALYPGLFMYHCAYHTEGNIAAVHMANGMYGFLIIDPQVPLPLVNHEFMLIESEFYVEKDGKSTGSCSFSDLVAETPTYVVFNGKTADLNAPLSVATGDRVRLYMGRGGVNGFAAFHVVGAVFDNVYRDGDLVDPPQGHGIQTVTVPPGGATVVEFSTPVPGILMAVDHNMSRATFKGTGQLINVTGPQNKEIYEVIEPAKH